MVKGTISGRYYLHGVKSCPEKSKYGDRLHSIIIAIDYSYKLGRKFFSFIVQTRPVIAQIDTHMFHSDCSIKELSMV